MTAAVERLRARIDQRTLWEVEADIREVVAENDRLRAEVAGLRQEVVDARGEATAEMARADLAEAQWDQALAENERRGIIVNGWRNAAYAQARGTTPKPAAGPADYSEAGVGAWYRATYLKCASCDTPDTVKPLTFRLPNGGGDLCADCAKPVIESTRVIEELIARKNARAEGS